MAWTFGAATSDDIQSNTQTRGGTQNTGIHGGWFYPTTLTGGNYLFSFGNVIGLSHDTGDTSELRFILDRATTDNEWVSTGAGITTNKWWFIAVAHQQVNASTSLVRIWVGDDTTPPTEVTMSNPTPGSGNYTGSNAFTIGNRGTGTVAFQGDIGDVFTTGGSAGTAVFPVTYWIASAGDISTYAAEQIRANLLIPMWAGRPDEFWRACQQGGQLDVGTMTFGYFPMNAGPCAGYAWGQSTTYQGYKIPTINGATYSQNLNPHHFTGMPTTVPRVHLR